MLVSIGIILTILFACDRLRNYIISKTNRTKLIHNLILDVILTIELCTVSLELGVVFKHYGFWIWLVGLYVNCFYQCIRWKNVNPPSPYFHMVDCISGQKSLLHVVVRCTVLMISGLATYHLILSQIWKLEVSVLHLGRLEETSIKRCSVPWAAKVPVIQSFAAELFGTFILDIAINLVMENPTMQNNEPMISSAIVSGLIALVVSLAFDISGGMFNPMLATVLLGGCKGNSTVEHVTIYWIGASLGAILAYFMFPKVKQMVYPSSEKTIKQETKDENKTPSKIKSS